MRVAYLINQYPKVSHSFIRREIAALERQGVTVDRYAIRTNAGELVDPADMAELKRTRVLWDEGKSGLLLQAVRSFLAFPGPAIAALGLALKLGWRSERGLLLHVVYWVQALILCACLKERPVDHLHAHFGTNSSTVACLISHICGVPFSFTVHGPEEFDKPAHIGLPEKTVRAQSVMAISSYGRSQLYRLVEYGDWPRIHVVHCGLEADFFAAKAPALPQSPSFVCVGRLCEQKGQALLLEAWASLAQRGHRPKLVLAGDGPMRSAIETRRAELGLEDCVDITGWISSDAVKQYLAKSTALVLPSFAEGLPVVIMEAMAQYRPVLSTYVAGIPELVRPGETGWLVPAGDVHALVDALEDLISADPKQLKTMGRSAYSAVKTAHHIDTEAAKLIAIWSGAATIEQQPNQPAQAA